jgi:uncharacterized protein (DUF2267 family)
MTAMIPTFHQTAVTSTQWVNELMEELDLHDDRQGLRALRAGLHVLRDRLAVEEVVELGAQLPMTIRGLFYEGWRLPAGPAPASTFAQLTESVHAGLDNDPSLDPAAVLRAVVRVLGRRVAVPVLADLCQPPPITRMCADQAP